MVKAGAVKKAARFAVYVATWEVVMNEVIDWVMEGERRDFTGVL